MAKTVTLSINRMHEWVTHYRIISGYGALELEWPSRQDIFDCFAELLASKNGGDILRLNYDNLRLENGRYRYDIEPNQ